MKVAVIVLNYNGKENTAECISSLEKSAADFELEIILVDNNSSDGSIEFFRKYKNITLIINENNLGYAGGNNVGIKHALNINSDFICILNNDIKVQKDMLANLLNSANNAIISPKIYFYPGQEFHQSKYKKSERGKVFWYAGGFIDWDNIIGKHRGVDEVDKGQYDKEEEVGFATGACMFTSADVFKKVGMFDERYFLYLEDLDFCIKAKKFGIKTIYQPKAIMWHKNAQSAGGPGSKLQDYYITRNRLLFAFQYARFRTKLAVFKQTLSQINVRPRRQALFDFITMKFGKKEE